MHCCLRNLRSPSASRHSHSKALVAKERSLVYISAPYRGLHLLAPLFQEIRSRLGGDVVLKVFSDFCRDDMPTMDEEDCEALSAEQVSARFRSPEAKGINQMYEPLYTALAQTEGVEFYGSVPQKVLFKHMQRSMVLFYPNVFPETCCTSVLEAFACRCMVVTSDLGALAETTGGLADTFGLGINVEKAGGVAEYLQDPIPCSQLDPQYVNDLIDAAVSIVGGFGKPGNVERVEQQMQFIHARCLWSQKADWFMCNILSL